MMFDFLKIFKKEVVEEIGLLERVHRCPFCFEQVRANDVHFRSSWEEDIVDDPLFDAYCQKNGIATEAKSAFFTLEDSEIINKEVKEDGVIIGIETNDGRYHRTKLCPKCHNDLPTDFGHYPLINISLYGTTMSGKSTYLYELLNIAPNKIATSHGGAMFPIGNDYERILEKIRGQESQVAAATTVSEYLPPVIYKLTINGHTYLCAICDIAGESVHNDEQMLNKLNQFRYSDGLIMLVHPDVDSINTGNNRNALDGLQQNNRMITSFNNHLNRRIDARLAVVLGKSDRLQQREDATNYSKLFEDTDRLNASDLRTINSQVRAYLGKIEQRNFMNAIDEFYPNDEEFEKHHYFAVSCLGADPDENGGIDFIHNSTRLIEPFLWILRGAGVNLGDD
ncbi:hypothetical protein PFZ59_01410 [Streptococcus suis]|uniref:TRAFAC clade GTPase domain-containing protein n=1 Tax=Streptococcus suis TaxID=1307 RepID=UPI00240D8A57|nr:hypothetical protein [Streptococcus suis]WFA76178.1 hypothetical protein PFZ59_01410 [Streptococcus suis]